MRDYRLLDDSTPNLGDAIADSWKFVRRFFIYDTISGITQPDGYKSGKKPSYVRWASDVKMKVELDPNNPEKLYRPYLIIDYQEKDAAIVESSSKTQVSFKMEYYSDYSDFMGRVLIGFICMNVLVIIVVLIRFRQFTNRNPKEVLGRSIYKAYIFKGIFYFIVAWSDIMFWLLFWSTFSIFISFKHSMNAVQLLPEPGQASDYVYNSFNVVFGMTLAFKFIGVVLRIYEQTNIDVHIIDFERPNASTGHVNAWR